MAEETITVITPEPSPAEIEEDETQWLVERLDAQDGMHRSCLEVMTRLESSVVSQLLTASTELRAIVQSQQEQLTQLVTTMATLSAIPTQPSIVVTETEVENESEEEDHAVVPEPEEESEPAPKPPKRRKL